MNQSLAKKFVQMLTLLCILPVFLVYRVVAVADKNGAFAASSQFLSLLPGKLGSYCRNSFYHLTMTHCDQGVVIGFGTVFSQSDTEISHGTYIGPQCNIGSCKIRQDTLIGSGVHILSGKLQHSFESTDIPIRDQGGSLTKVEIGEDSWIGNGSIIMADIGNKSIVAAGSVVTQAVADNQIVAGNPATVKRTR